MATMRKDKKAATRQALKAAALSCFTKQGYLEASIRSITREAGVAHGTFYVHFPSKEAALDELLADFNAGFIERVLPIVSDMGERAPRQLIRATAQVFLDYWSEHRAFIESYVQRVAQGLSLIAMRDGLSPPLMKTVSGWVAVMAKARGHEVANVDFIAQSLLAMWFRVGLQVLFSDQVNRDEALDLLERMTWGAVAAVLPTAVEENRDL